MPFDPAFLMLFHTLTSRLKWLRFISAYKNGDPSEQIPDRDDGSLSFHESIAPFLFLPSVYADIRIFLLNCALELRQCIVIGSISVEIVLHRGLEFLVASLIVNGDVAHIYLLSTC